MYVNTAGNNATLSSAQVAALDPQGIGFSPALLSLINTRYPHANDLSRGDGLNTGGFDFNAPSPRRENDFVIKLDYNLNSKMKLFGRGTVARVNTTQTAIQFPGDPVTSPFVDRSYAWVVGHNWAISNTKVNQVSYGETVADFSFPNTYNPTGITQYGIFGGNGSGGSILSSPYASAINAQARNYPIPVVRDDFSWEKGAHSLKFGGTFKWPSPKSVTILNYNSPTIGLGGNTAQLNSSLEPADICNGGPCTVANPQGSNAIPLYDSAFALALAPFTAVGSTFNYNAQGTVLPQGSGSHGDYRYYETELYFGDSWKVRPTLTLSYGVRWSNYTVPYEIHGLESVQSTGFDTYFGARVAQSAAGASGNLAVPLISYGLGGKANHAPDYFHPEHKNFGPRLAFAYSPQKYNSKVVFNGGAGIIYDQTIINAVQYQQSQYSYLFQASATQPFGVPGDPVTSLQNDARFTGVGNPPTPPTPPTITKPFFPFVAGSGANAVPFGLANGQAFNETIDPKLKTPYSIQYGLGFQQEVAHGYILKVNYVGRLGRRLLAQADANQLVDFPDKISGQLMSAAFASITQQLRAGVNPLNVTPQPWYENVLLPGAGPVFGVPNNTALVAAFLSTLVQRGDFADTTQALAAVGTAGGALSGPLLPPNVGMGSQFSENTFYTNKGFSSYNGLLTTLHKNLGYGLQFDLNYTWSHSIDNVSVIANAPAIGGYGFICDVQRTRECRGNSDFDVTHYFNGNFIYALPFGRGRSFAPTASRLLDEIIGGWEVSGLPNWHSGLAYFATGNAFVAGYANNAPSILTGPASDLRIHLNGGKGQPLLAYANPTQANLDFTGPVGFNIGARNNLRGPGYFNLDMGLGKTFRLSAERVQLKFRADAFNVFNHPNFDLPAHDITNSGSNPFGVISSTVGSGLNNGGPSARVLQLALRLEF